MHRLAYFDQQQTAVLAKAVLKNPVASSMVRGIFERSEGNQFFVVELLREYIGARKSALDPVGLNVPGTVQGLVEQRFRKLPRDVQTTLETAAIIGNEFELLLLRIATDLSGSELNRRLELALSSGLVQSRPGARATLRFQHALVSDAISNSLAFSRK